MKIGPILAGAAILGSTAILSAQDRRVSSAAAEAFGELDQELYVGAAEFRPTGSDNSYRFYDDGYLYREAESFDYDEYLAPLRLPSGARIHELCLYGFGSTSTGFAEVRLDAVKLVPAGAQPGVVSVPGSHIFFNWQFGHGVMCTDPSFSYTYRETGDVDGDGNLEHITHRLRVGIQEHEAGINTRVGGVGVFWRRQVSPAPATASFGDVPADHPFFQFVEALAASGITAGCSGGNFCPDSPLTRGQMAVFLAKALGLHWPY
jgi:hypothetical protein